MNSLRRLWGGVPDQRFLPVLVAVFLIGMAFTAMAWIPIGAASAATGRVLAMGDGGGKYGANPWASVELADRTVTLHTFTKLRCAVGGTVEVRRQRHVWGWTFSAGSTHCDDAAGDAGLG